MYVFFFLNQKFSNSDSPWTHCYFYYLITTIDYSSILGATFIFLTSYVIQNFSRNNRFLNVTPRFRVLTLYTNILNIFIMSRVGNFFFFFNNFNFISTKFLFILYFYKLFFNTKIYELFLSIKFKIKQNYSNNFAHSLHYWSFKKFNTLGDPNQIKNFPNALFPHDLDTAYFASIKLAYPVINFKISKNFFFFLLLTAGRFWNNNQSVIFFQKNFLFNMDELVNFIFYSGPFFKIYTF